KVPKVLSAVAGSRDRIIGAGHRERTQVQHRSRRLRSGERIPYQVRTPKELARAVVVVLELPGHAVRLATSQSRHTVDTPAFREGITAPREFVGPEPLEAVADIEVRTCLLRSRVEAVVGLCRVRDEVLTIARGVDGVSPRVVHGRGEAVPVTD